MPIRFGTFNKTNLDFDATKTAKDIVDQFK